jgi:hypothetical protein
LAAANGIGRIDMVENRYVGMKSRGCYETPGGTILLKAHRAIESLTLDREAAHLKDELMPRYASLVYNGYLVRPEREMLQAAHRPDPAGGQRRGTPQALQGQRHGRRPQVRTNASSTPTSPPSRRMPAPTTRATPPASFA